MILATHDFADGTIGPLIDVWQTRDASSDPDLKVIPDPTGSGRGNVARMRYRPSATERSKDVGVGCDRRTKPVRYGETIWMRGDVFYPAPPLGGQRHNRKTIDFLGGGDHGIHTRVCIHRRDQQLLVSITDYRDGYARERYDDPTGIYIPDDVWTTVEARMTTNTKSTRNDGILRIYVHKRFYADYSRTSGLGWITDKYPGTSFFDVFYVGSQLTIDLGDPIYSEERYWDNVTFSTTRLPR